MEARKLTLSTVSTGPGGQSLTSNRGGPGSRSGQVTWDLWWTKWRCGRIPRVPRVLTRHLPSSWANTIGQTMADVSSGLNLTKPRETNKNCFTSSRNISVSQFYFTTDFEAVRPTVPFCEWTSFTTIFVTVFKSVEEQHPQLRCPKKGLIVDLLFSVHGRTHQPWT